MIRHIKRPCTVNHAR